MNVGERNSSLSLSRRKKKKMNSLSFEVTQDVYNTYIDKFMCTISKIVWEIRRGGNDSVKVVELRRQFTLLKDFLTKTGVMMNLESGSIMVNNERALLEFEEEINQQRISSFCGHLRGALSQPDSLSSRPAIEAFLTGVVNLIPLLIEVPGEVNDIVKEARTFLASRDEPACGMCGATLSKARAAPSNERVATIPPQTSEREENGVN